VAQAPEFTSGASLRNAGRPQEARRHSEQQFADGLVAARAPEFLVDSLLPLEPQVAPAWPDGRLSRSRLVCSHLLAIWFAPKGNLDLGISNADVVQTNCNIIRDDFPHVVSHHSAHWVSSLQENGIKIDSL